VSSEAFGDARTTRLANWVASAEGQQDCRQVFLNDSGVADWGIDDTGILQQTWELMNSSDWANIENPTISIDAEMVDIFLPESSEDRLQCTDNSLSDAQSFLTANDEPSDFVFTLDAGDAVLVGPSYSGGSLTASPMLHSQRTLCDEADCSMLRLSNDSGVHVVDAMRLDSYGDTVVSNSEIEITVDSFRIELVGPLPADSSSANAFTINRDGAVFVVNGLVEGVPHMIPVKNVTPIKFTRSGTGWKSSSFAVQHLDVERETWHLTVAAATWD
jgi:hypothetical protein